MKWIGIISKSLVPSKCIPSSTSYNETSEVSKGKYKFNEVSQSESPTAVNNVSVLNERTNERTLPLFVTEGPGEN